MGSSSLLVMMFDRTCGFATVYRNSEKMPQPPNCPQHKDIQSPFTKSDEDPTSWVIVTFGDINLEEAMTAEIATLVAAVVAALSAIYGVIVSNRTALAVAKETGRAEQTREVSAFYRERLAKMKDMMFENAIALDTLRENCRNVPWLAKTHIEDIVERSNTAIACITYALAELREMQAATDASNNAVSMLRHRFPRFASYVALYQEQIANGNITLYGHAENDVASRAEKNFIQGHEEWGQHLEKLRTLIVSLSVTPETERHSIK
jgi:hypothetical protein